MLTGSSGSLLYPKQDDVVWRGEGRAGQQLFLEVEVYPGGLEAGLQEASPKSSASLKSVLS